MKQRWDGTLNPEPWWEVDILGLQLRSLVGDGILQLSVRKIIVVASYRDHSKALWVFDIYFNNALCTYSHYRDCKTRLGRGGAVVLRVRTAGLANGFSSSSSLLLLLLCLPTQLLQSIQSLLLLFDLFVLCGLPFGY